MDRVRRRISIVACVWLLSHVATIALTLTGLCCRNMPPVASSAEDEMCTGMMAGQICPMHKHGAHHSTHSPAKPDPTSVLRSGCGMDTMGIGAVTLDLALIPDSTPVSDDAGATAVTLLVTSPLTSDTFPDLPPPRA